MTKPLRYLVSALLVSGFAYRAHAQTTPGGGIGIGTATPDASALLDLTSSTRGLLPPRLTAGQRAAIASPAVGLLVYQTDGVQAGVWYYAASGWTFVNPSPAGDNLGNHLATQNIGLNDNAIRLRGVTDSNHGLQFDNAVNGPSLFGYYGGSLGFTSSGALQRVLVWTNNGNVGIGTGNPAANLDVNGSTRLRGLTTAGFVMTDASGNLSSNATVPGDNLGNHLATQNIGLNDNAIRLRGAADSNHGLQFDNAVNGPSLFGYYGGSLGFTSSGALQRVLVWTNNGNVGIGTGNPAFPLDVQSTTTPGGYNYAFLSTGQGQNGQLGYASGGTGAVSIRAAGRVVAAEFNATSDARLKRVLGPSDATRDLALLRRLRVTDYQMLDRAQYGDRQFKKVIAQEVEQVFPQAVGQHAGFLPDVYAPASAATALPGDSLLLLTLPRALPGAVQAGQRVKLLSARGEQLGRVVRVPDGRALVVRGAAGLAGQRVFVFGLEHADVRTVDYEALAMLNVSATQELARQLAELQRQNADLRAQTQAQATRLDQQQAALQSQATDAAHLAQRLLALEAQLAPPAQAMLAK